MPSLWSNSLKTETTQTELTQQPQPPRGAGSFHALSCPRCSFGTWGTSRDGQLHGVQRHPNTLPAHLLGFTPVGSILVPFAVTERAAIWCRGWRQLGTSPGRGCAFGRRNEPAPFPQTPFWQLRKALCIAQRSAAVYSKPSQQCPLAGLHSPI